MQRGSIVATLVALLIGLSSAQSMAQEHLEILQRGSVALQFAGPMTFGPDGVLFVGDPMAAKIYALDTGDRTSGNYGEDFAVEMINDKIAAALGTKADEILINDMAVNPISGMPYLSVARGRGPDGQAVILKVAADGTISELELKNIPHAAAQIPNAPDENQTDRRGRPQRMLAITDISLIDNQVVVAGLSNEEFSSNLRSIRYPFTDAPEGTALEVYHGAHGRYETNSPVRTFTTITLDDEPYIVAAYTCTPLVRFPLSDIAKSEKIRGTTVAELGNRNQPLDMFVYEKDGENFILMANSSRGMMKISTEGIDRPDGITSHIRGGGKAGQTYDTIDELNTVVQLDRLSDSHAMVIMKSGESGLDLRVVPLP